ncbi:hypothetical protein FSARC_9688 [Fusarium sarcochroum]|uniref:DUF7730 domain-containing protein n=1 Tax=Fusarium sarcochroum TaxID=1208366 RepID=A0A8H4X604_9HYPO|nr:hypothetical protein FSARC_9688 [Fusarium sarcochroum]
MSGLSLSKSSPFLAIPLEIRQRIYRHCIPKNDNLIISSEMCYKSVVQGDFTLGHSHSLDCSSIDWTDPAELTEISMDEESIINIGSQSALSQLLTLCRQITDEVKALLYGGNVFQISIPPHGAIDLSKSVGLEATDYMRRMVLVFKPQGICSSNGSYMDPRIWDGLLRKLSMLGIIIDQPKSTNPDSFDQEGAGSSLKERTEWLILTLEYLDRAVPSTTKIMVDVNEVESAVHMVERAMPSRCTFQNLLAGDYIFERGRYSEEAGYWDDYDDGPTSCRDIINDCDYDYYYSD